MFLSAYIKSKNFPSKETELSWLMAYSENVYDKHLWAKN